MGQSQRVGTGAHDTEDRRGDRFALDGTRSGSPERGDLFAVGYDSGRGEWIRLRQ